MTGLTSSEDFPVTPDAYQSTLDGSESSPDAFVTRLAPDGSTLGYSTFFGGSSFEQGNGIAVDRRGDAYFIGEGGASTPTTPGAYDTTSVFGEFVAKLDIGPGAAARLELSPSSAENEVDTEHCVTALVADSGGRPVWDVLVRFSVSGANASSGSAPTDDDGRARFCYPGVLLGTDSISAYADFDPANGTREPSEPTGTAIKVWLPRRPFCRAHVSGSGWSERTRLMPEFVATSTAVRGRVVYREPGGPAFRSSRLVATSCDPDGRVSVFGTAQVGGSPLQFRLDLEDHGEPGRDSDIFRMRVAGGTTQASAFCPAETSGSCCAERRGRRGSPNPLVHSPVTGAGATHARGGFNFARY